MCQPRIARLSLFLFALLAGSAWADKVDDGWRRTIQGWEQKSAWQTAVDVHPAPVEPILWVHPGQLATLQIAASCLALGLFSPSVLGVSLRNRH